MSCSPLEGPGPARAFRARAERTLPFILNCLMRAVSASPNLGSRDVNSGNCNAKLHAAPRYPSPAWYYRVVQPSSQHRGCLLAYESSQDSKSTLPPLWVFNIRHHPTVTEPFCLLSYRAESIFLDTDFDCQPCGQSMFCFSRLDVTPSEQQHRAGEPLLCLARRNSPRAVQEHCRSQANRQPHTVRLKDGSLRSLQ